MNELLQYLKERIESIETKTESRFDRLDFKMDQMLAFKWKITGGTLVISVLITIIFQIGMLLARMGKI